jgi:hypothetical protein
MNFQSIIVDCGGRMRVINLWILTGALLAFFGTGMSAADDTLCTPDPSPEAVALYRYLLDMKGDKILSGQMYAPWGINELQYIKNITGKQPAVMGVDFITQFWWGKQGPEKFKRLWTTMYDYFVHERGLNNLIWVLCYTGNPDPLWYPGDEYVDIAGADTYDAGNGPQTTMYNKVKSIINDKFPIAYHECGIPPVPDMCLAQNAMWSWWMEWHTTWLQGVDTAYLKRLYYHDLVITLDEVPDIMATYGWDSTCTTPVITPYIKINSGNRQQTSRIAVNSGDTVSMYIASGGEGQCTWSGYGTSGIDSAQQVIFSNAGSVIASFTNTCGATSVVAFNLTDACPAPLIMPYVRVDNNAWLTSTSVTINYGAVIKLSPQPVTGGTWNWTGFMTSASREITFTPDTTCVLTASFTNTCNRTSRKNFKITVNCPATAITPYIQINQGVRALKSSITINSGDSVTLSPLPSSGGSWKWTGAINSTDRIVTLKPAVSCTTQAIFTNDCRVKTTRNFTFTVVSVPVNQVPSISMKAVTLYPNPAGDVIYLNQDDILKLGKISIRIISLQGNELLKTNKALTSIDISALPPGMYLLSVQTQGRIITQSFVKNKT